MAKKKTDSNRDELTGLLAESLNKKFSKTHHKVAYFLDGSEDSPTDVDDWVSTGSTVLDLAISNRPNGGFPVSKIVEITGLEQSGKSLLASHIIANTQKKDGVAIYIDTESRKRFESGMSALEAAKEIDLDYQEHRQAVVFINGEYWGLHTIRDRLDENYLARHLYFL